MVVNITGSRLKGAFLFAKECDVNVLFTELTLQLILENVLENIVSNSRSCKVKE